jgi:hypothetical protein
MPLPDEKYCLTCAKVLRGRSDKKFCDDYCRNSYNNQLKQLNSVAVRAINRVLRKNRHILESIVGTRGVSVNVAREELIREGFYFNYITHSGINRRGNTYYYCYDYGYRLLEDDRILVVKEP